MPGSWLVRERGKSWCFGRGVWKKASLSSFNRLVKVPERLCLDHGLQNAVELVIDLLLLLVGCQRALFSDSPTSGSEQCMLVSGAGTASQSSTVPVAYKEVSHCCHLSRV